MISDEKRSFVTEITPVPFMYAITSSWCSLRTELILFALAGVLSSKLIIDNYKNYHYTAKLTSFFAFQKTACMYTK